VFESLWGENWTKDVPAFQVLANNLIKVGRTFAPALAAKGLWDLRMGEIVPALGHLVWLWVWIVPGAFLGYFVFERYYIGDGGKIDRRADRQQVHRQHQDKATLSVARMIPSFLPSEILAVAAKEWRYLLRSLVGKLNLVLVPLMATVGIFVFARRLENPILGIDAEIIAFFGILFFISQVVNNFMYNSFAWEGSGVQSYFVSPASLQQVLLGKNLGLWCYYAVLFLLVIAIWIVIKGMMSGITLLSGIIFFAAVNLSFTSIGNFLSIMFPVPKDISARDNSVSQTAIVLSIASLAVVAVITGIFLVVPVLLDVPSLQPLFLAVLLAIQIGVYFWAVRLAARLLMERREKVIAALGSRPLGLTGS
jgi:hypothetical protein